MAVACFNLQERLVPYLRSLTAKELADRGLRQERIAGHLGVSQAMVSKYLQKAPRPAPGVPRDLVDTLVATAVDEAMAHEERGGVGAYCPVCTSLSAHGVQASERPVDEIQQCLRRDQPVARKDQEAVLEELAKAERWIQRADLRALQPAVRMNLALSLPDARDVRDVAAFPGRLVDLKGRVAAVSEPEFGSSSHLASLLLKIRKHDDQARVILNLRWNPDVQRAADAVGLRLHRMTRKGDDLIVALPDDGRLDGVVDPGGFGIEPNLYLIGPEAPHVVERAVALRKALEATE